MKAILILSELHLHQNWMVSLLTSVNIKIKYKMISRIQFLQTCYPFFGIQVIKNREKSKIRLINIQMKTT